MRAASDGNVSTNTTHLEKELRDETNIEINDVFKVTRLPVLTRIGASTASAAVCLCNVGALIIRIGSWRSLDYSLSLSLLCHHQASLIIVLSKYNI